jgi:hypothetical protein
LQLNVLACYSHPGSFHGADDGRLGIVRCLEQGVGSMYGAGC